MDKVEDTKAHVVIIILNWNQKDYSIKCLESLFEINYLHFEVVLVDNGSTDDSVKVITSMFPNVQLIKNGRNMGVAGGRNVGIKYANDYIPYEYLLFLDNDLVVEIDFLSELVKAVESDPDVGLANPKICDISKPGVIQFAGNYKLNFYTCTFSSEAYGLMDEGQFDRPKYSMLAIGCCMLVRKEVIDKINCFDDIFNPYGGEDDDFSLRAGKEGFKILYVPAAVIHHKSSKTYSGGEYNEAYARLKGRHLKILMQRYASPLQKGCFLLVAPFLGIRTLIREVRRGNGRAAIALFKSYFSG